MRSKENKHNWRPRPTSRLERLHTLREARGLWGVSSGAHSPREVMAGFRGLTFCISSSRSSWGPIWFQGSLILGSPLHLKFLASAERALSGRPIVQHLHTTPHGCLSGRRLDGMVLGNGGQWDMILGKGLPLATDRDSHAEGQATEPCTQERPEALQFN